MRKLDDNDKWLMDEILTEIQEMYQVSKIEAWHMVVNANFLRLLDRHSEKAHHDSPHFWAIDIGKRNGFEKQ